MRRQLLKPGHPDIILSLLRLADSLPADEPEREALYREALALQQEYGVSDSLRQVFILDRLGRLLCDRRPEEAPVHLGDALAVLRNSAAADQRRAGSIEAWLGRCLAEVDPERGRRHLRTAVSTLTESLGPDHSTTRRAVEWLDASEEGPEL